MSLRRAPAPGAGLRAGAGDRRAARAARPQPARPRRRRGRARRRAAQAEIVAASGRRPLTAPQRALDGVARPPRAAAARAGDRRRRRPARCSPTARGTARAAPTTATGPEIAAALRGDVVAGPAPQRHARPGDPRHRRADPRSAATRAGAVRVTQSVDAVNRAAVDRATIGLVAIGLLVLGARASVAGALIAGQVAAAGAPRSTRRPARRRGRPRRARAPVEGSAEQRRLARTFNEMTERAVERARGEPARVRRRRLAPAAHAAGRPAAAARGGARRRPPTRAPARRSTPALREVDRLSAIVSELLVLCQAGEVDAPPERASTSRTPRAARPSAGTAPRGGRGASRAERRAGDAASARAPTSTGSLDVLVENALAYGPAQRRGRARAPGALEVLDAGPGLAPDEAEPSSSASTAAARAAPGRPGPGSGCRSRASSRAAGAATVTLANRDGGGARAVVTVPALSPRLTDRALRWSHASHRALDSSPPSPASCVVAGVTAAACDAVDADGRPLLRAAHGGRPARSAQDRDADAGAPQGAGHAEAEEAQAPRRHEQRVVRRVGRVRHLGHVRRRRPRRVVGRVRRRVRLEFLGLELVGLDAGRLRLLLRRLRVLRRLRLVRRLGRRRRLGPRRRRRRLTGRGGGRPGVPSDRTADARRRPLAAT